jgi:microcystin-dependent protein
MGSTLVLSGGAANTKTLKELLTQTSHGFVVGDVVRVEPSTSRYVRAKADNAANSEVVGIVNSVVDVDNFEVTYSGYISIPSLAGVSYPVMFLSGQTAGELTNTPPSFIGSVVKAVASRNHLSGGYIVTNYLGTQIGGSSTVSIDEVQPVGSITPYAGAVIPETWLDCNGASYAIADYAELYAKLLGSGGLPIYGYVATLSGVGAVSANFAVLDVIQFRASSGTFTGSLYDSPEADVIGIITAVTSSASTTASGTLTVQVIPKYVTADKKFQFPTILFGQGVGINAATTVGTGNYRVFNPNTTLRTGIVHLNVTSAAITHFNTPDIRGRFVVGSNPTSIGDNLGEADATYNSSLGQFSLGQEGGSETIAQTANVAGWNAGADEVTVAAGTSIKPPYLATKYIIKAKPYTRAAIVEALDFPYSEGTFTSQITYSTTLTNTAPSTADKTVTLRYIKIGKQVTVWSNEMTLANTFSGVAAVIINSFTLPFAAVNTNTGIGNMFGYIQRGQYASTVSSYESTTTLTAVSNVLYPRVTLSNGLFGFVLLDNTSSVFAFSATYQTA